MLLVMLVGLSFAITFEMNNMVIILGFAAYECFM